MWRTENKVASTNPKSKIDIKTQTELNNHFKSQEKFQYRHESKSEKEKSIFDLKGKMKVFEIVQEKKGGGVTRGHYERGKPRKSSESEIKPEIEEKFRGWASKEPVKTTRKSFAKNFKGGQASKEPEKTGKSFATNFKGGQAREKGQKVEENCDMLEPNQTLKK